ncbi:holin family protein [Sedimentimonas flavescens]|uniref:holin family protein n=1 Tax=Sedimentimonas flavescens TaxID=2851012 RepID=UPI0021A40B32|nr:holin family protein [Sedimentimonas flavescens]MCT2539264.1 holin family protein [Sedimentimonas flavescens]WBL32530.1 holin family protein [Sinirhodobacter sp. HNIBRBA609]
MGLIEKVVGGSATTTALGNAAATVAEVFVPNATKKMEAAHDAYRAALDEHGAEFQYVRPGLFDRFVNGLNRMPRPMLALGTLGLFVYAMIDPEGFSRRMVGLNHVPEPLWWLLGAIVSFYFGAREAYYFRTKPVVAAAPAPMDDNPALSEIEARRAGA